MFRFQFVLTFSFYQLQDQFAQEALRYQQEEAEMKRYVKGLEDQMKVAGSSEVVYRLLNLLLGEHLRIVICCSLDC